MRIASNICPVKTSSVDTVVTVTAGADVISPRIAVPYKYLFKKKVTWGENI